MIQIDYTPTNYQIPVMLGKDLDEFLDMQELRAIKERQAKRENERFNAHDASMYQAFKRHNDLLDRAYNAVRAKNSKAYDEDVEYLIENGHWELVPDNIKARWASEGWDG